MANVFTRIKDKEIPRSAQRLIEVYQSTDDRIHSLIDAADEMTRIGTDDDGRINLIENEIAYLDKVKFHLQLAIGMIVKEQNSK